MEDRFTPGLWLEMTHQAPDAYSAGRVPEVVALPGVTRATWWENVHLDRADLPRVLPEFTLLGVYEVDDDFTAPGTPEGVDGLHFRRTPRPGQGSLSGRPTIGLSLVLISPTRPEDAQALRDWGDFVHIRHIAQVGVPGYTMITPYENATGGDPRYLHFYEMDTEDPELAFKSMTPLVEQLIGGQGTPEFAQWGWHDALRIMYVNSFKRLGELAAPIS
jgi:hypothetical protein